MILEETYTLNNGISIPKLAFGTWQIPNEKTPAAVNAALELGYRNIDTAVLYENEEGVGQGIRESGVPRNEIFVTTKIPPTVQTYEGAKECIESSIEKLGIGVIDQVLIHSPKPWKELIAGSPKHYLEENLAVWKAMEEAVRDGKVRSIGVSNFDTTDLENIIQHGSIKPAVNQLEVHISHVPTKVLDFCRDNDILVEAYSPNATGRLMDDPTVNRIAQKYGVSVPQLSLRYDVQLGVLPLPRSTNPEHIKQNAQLDFVISDEDMAALDKVKEKANPYWGGAAGKAARKLRGAEF